VHPQEGYESDAKTTRERDGYEYKRYLPACLTTGLLDSNTKVMHGGHHSRKADEIAIGSL
jgi:hypothetical protein